MRPLRFKWLRRLLLKLALGNSTYDYMVRTVLNDPRTPTARWVDIVVRKDGHEIRTEADWIKKLSKIVGTSKRIAEAKSYRDTLKREGLI